MVLEYPIVVAKIKITDATAEVLWSQDIPKGLVGGRVLIEYADEKWNELNKTVIFRGAVTRDVLSNDTEVIIPAEVLSRSGMNFYVGVYGTNAEKNLGVPTFWAKVGVIRDAADPNSDPAADPSLPVWAGLLERTPDWDALPGTDNHILNRTHWKQVQKAANTYDGSLEGRTFHTIEVGYTFVKISDRVLTEEDLIGSTILLHSEDISDSDFPDSDFSIEVTEGMLYDMRTDMGFPVIAVSELAMCVQADFNLYGIFVEKGVYVLRADEDGTLLGYVKSMSALPDEEEVYHKLDSRYIDAEWLAGRTEGSEVVLEESTQQFYSGDPCYARQYFLFTLESNQEYTVRWDGENYPCRVGIVMADYVIGYFLGNASLFSSDYTNTGEPFCVIHVSIMGIPLITEIAASGDATEHTIAILKTGQVRKRLPFHYLPQDYIFPNDLYDSEVSNNHLEQAYFHLLNGGTVYANYSDNRFRVLAIDLDIWDSQFHSMIMTNGDVIMMWSEDTGWLKQSKNSFMLMGDNGRKYRITVNSNGQLVTSDVTNDTIYV
jgi:hypothetical protein